MTNEVLQGSLRAVKLRVWSSACSTGEEPLSLAMALLPIVIVQHMPPGFTRPLAERFDMACRLLVKETEDGMVLQPGLVAIAPAGQQFGVRRGLRNDVEVALAPDEGHSVHVPSVDVMMTSVGRTYGAATLAAILTGMGQDGVNGLRCVKDWDGYVIGQDAPSCVVYGMPRAAAQAGLVDRVVSLDEIAQTLCELTNTSFARS